jgi:hypothetical protein
MPAVLWLATATKKNRSAWSKSLLLSSSRVVTVRKDPQNATSKSILYYDVSAGKIPGTWELLLSHPINTIATRIGSEDPTNAILKVNVLGYQFGGGREKPTSGDDVIWEISVDKIVYAYDLSNGTQSHIFLDNGSGLIRLLTSHTVADLSRSVSKSASLSRS